MKIAFTSLFFVNNSCYRSAPYYSLLIIFYKQSSYTTFGCLVLRLQICWYSGNHNCCLTAYYPL